MSTEFEEEVISSLKEFTEELELRSRKTTRELLLEEALQGLAMWSELLLDHLQGGDHDLLESKLKAMARIPGGKCLFADRIHRLLAEKKG